MGNRISKLRRKFKLFRPISSFTTTATFTVDEEEDDDEDISISTASSFDRRESKRPKSREAPSNSSSEYRKKILKGKMKIALRENSSIHHIIKTLINGNFNAPVNDLLQNGNAKVLEVGCSNGNGIWTIDMARDYPLTYFIGVDSSFPINVSRLSRNSFDLDFESMPNNFHFDHADIFSKLPYSNDEFDLVFVKMMGIVLPGGNQAWKQFVEELVRVTKPGGYLEIIDPDFKPYNAGPIYNQFYHSFEQALTYQGVDPLQGDALSKLLDNQPLLASVTCDYVSAPIGWSGEIGTKILEIIGLIMISLSPELSSFFGQAKRPNNREYELLINSCIQECQERDVFYNLRYAYAVKNNNNITI